MARSRSENAEYVIDFITSLGSEPHPQSRLMKMHRVLTEANGIIERSDRRFETALEAERDMQILGFIIEQIEKGPHDPEFKQRFQVVAKDSIQPQDDRVHSKGRNMQFEMFVWAICHSAGLMPVVFEEPDVSCLVKSNKFGIAAKRLKSVEVLEQHIKKAANQIASSKLRGIIALDTCVALNRNNDRIVNPISDEEFGRLYDRALKKFIKTWHDRIQNWVRAKNVRGIVFHDHQVRFEPDGEWSLGSMTYFLCTARDNARRNKEFVAFQDAYLFGLPNLRGVRDSYAWIGG